jgi:hypothetical protein
MSSILSHAEELTNEPNLDILNQIDETIIKLVIKVT